MKIDLATAITAHDGSKIPFDLTTGTSKPDAAPLTIAGVLDLALRFPGHVRGPDRGGNVFPPEPLPLDEIKKRFDWIDKISVGGEIELSASDATYFQALVARAWTNVTVAGAAVRVLDGQMQWTTKP